MRNAVDVFGVRPDTPSRTMCALLAHRMVLPEDLRSQLLTSYGRGELTNYHRHLLRAVEAPN